MSQGSTGIFCTWMSVAPEGSPLLLSDIGKQESAGIAINQRATGASRDVNPVPTEFLGTVLFWTNSKSLCPYPPRIFRGPVRQKTIGRSRTCDPRKRSGFRDESLSSRAALGQEKENPMDARKESLRLQSEAPLQFLQKVEDQVIPLLKWAFLTNLSSSLIAERKFVSIAFGKTAKMPKPTP